MAQAQGWRARAPGRGCSPAAPRALSLLIKSSSSRQTYLFLAVVFVFHTEDIRVLARRWSPGRRRGRPCCMPAGFDPPVATLAARCTGTTHNIMATVADAPAAAAVPTRSGSTCGSSSCGWATGGAVAHAGRAAGASSSMPELVDHAAAGRPAAVGGWTAGGRSPRRALEAAAATSSTGASDATQIVTQVRSRVPIKPQNAGVMVDASAAARFFPCLSNEDA